MTRFFALLFATLLFSSSVGAQNRPLKTEWAETVEEGTLRFELGFEFFQEARFRVSGLRGDLSDIGVIGLRTGLSDRVELQLFWTAQRFLNVEERFPAPNDDLLDFAGNSTSDLGNLILGTKVKLIEETGGLPTVSFRFGVELPNGSNEKGISNDETDFRSELLLQKRWGRWSAVGNLGLAILGDPTSAGSQDDLLTYGAALLYEVTPEIRVLTDWNGRAGAGGIGTEEQSTLRIGTQVAAGGVYWDAALFIGLRDTDPDTGIIVGLSKDFSIPFLR